MIYCGYKGNIAVFTKTDYIAGRCHLFALALSKASGSPVTCVMDYEAMDDEMNIIPEPCLVHAYLKKEGHACDVNGWREDDVISSFPSNSPAHEEFSYQEFDALVKKMGLPDYEQGEEDQLLKLAHI